LPATSKANHQLRSGGGRVADAVRFAVMASARCAAVMRVDRDFAVAGCALWPLT
jgi:hypothetical protein